MYCNQCGTQLPEDASFCPSCGKKAKTTLTPPPTSKPNKEKRHTPKRIAIIIAIVLGICVLIGIAAFAISGTADEQKTIAVPTIERVEKKVNSIGDGTITFDVKESKYGYDVHRVIYNGTDVGVIYLNANSSEDVGIYIDKDRSESQKAFSQMAAGAMLACDPSINLDKAKELLNSAVDKSICKDAAENNDVSYSVHISDDRYILRIDVPEQQTD